MKALRRLLVPIDSAEPSAPAVEYAMWLAHYAGAELTFCHSVDVTGSVAEYTGAGDIGALIDKLEREGATLLADAQAKAQVRGLTSTTVELAGSPAAAIVEAAQQKQVSAIVMGSHGRSGPSRFFLGSTTESVLRRTDLPVFVVHSHSVATAAPLPFTHIVVALDDSDPADAAVDFALSIADPERTTVELVHVLHMKPLHQLATAQQYDVRRRFREERAAVQELLDTAADRIRERDVKVIKMTIDGAPIEELTGHAARQHADLIVIGTHGRRGLQRLFLGSIAEAVVRGATVPVVVVRRRTAPAQFEVTSATRTDEACVITRA